MKRCKICGFAVKIFIKNISDNRYGFPKRFDVYRCGNCGFGQTVPSLHNKQLTELYTNYYPRKNLTRTDTLREAVFEPTLKYRIKSFLLGTNNVCHQMVRPKTRVLDIGCGNGCSLIELKKIGCDAHGTEKDKNVERIARDLNLKIHIGDISDIPDKNLKFDYITASQVIEHIPNPQAFIKKLLSQLKQNGKLILSFPNINSLGRVIWREKWLNWHIPYHQNFFSQKSIEILAQKLSLKIEKIKTVTPSIWTQLQLVQVFYPHKPGQKSQLWQPKKQLRSKLFDRMINLIRWISNYLFIIPNRMIDVLGWGESFVIVLIKDDK
jgi:2-polyprenyl-3-methyl-5-hydroxy-6-metoxy-1,4-benzoquinol methylase